MADKGKENKKEPVPKTVPKAEREAEEYTPVHTPPPSTFVPEQPILRTGDHPVAGARRPEASICILDIDDSEIDTEERPSNTDSIKQLRLRRKQFEELRRDHYQMYYDDGSIISGSAIRGSNHQSEDEDGNGNGEDAEAVAEKKEEKQKPEEKEKDKDKAKN